ncbi:hypothetical protein AQUCO_07500044v1 [Aquilegia coerulea]|uniref:Uncharacterized protein n=1 Tax=Aquilegia coerulea TaxID=218851 RepID=A0A2G5C9A2_AQUCA|nr:hypothetical protein AQUCO_07500044v1 [Aquilegia coerulea]
MSRCLPFPPSGYEKNGLSGEDLVEWIKKEREQAKRERQKARKERKREKDEKEKCRGILGNGKNEHSHENICAVDLNKVYHDDELISKVKDGEIEQSDESDMTEEHEKPHNDQMAYESSDNTQNSNKRKLQNLLTDGSIDCLEQPSSACSTSEEIEFPTELVPRQEQLLCSTSGRTDFGFLDDAELTPEIRSSLIDHQLQFEELNKIWAPSQLQLEQTEFDDLGWLFDINHHPREEAKRPKLCSEEAVSCSSSLWPRAHYMSQLDMYVMPYTVPF